MALRIKTIFHEIMEKRGIKELNNVGDHNPDQDLSYLSIAQDANYLKHWRKVGMHPDIIMQVWERFDKDQYKTKGSV